MADSPAAVKSLPLTISVYDLLKSFAVIIMIIDHLGAYFFPEHLWFRTIGRIGFPVWFFLIGYGRNQKIPQSFWIGGAMLSATDLALGLWPLPLNALFSMAFIRLVLTPLMKSAGKNLWLLYIVLAGCFLLFDITDQMFEYGTLGFAFAMLGYIVRHAEEYKADFIRAFGFLCLAVFCTIMYMRFDFSPVQHLFNAVFSGAVIATLMYYLPKPHSYPKLDAQPLLKWPLQFMGRYTLEIYVAHLIIFKLIVFL